jgi:hypothetical protein
VDLLSFTGKHINDKDQINWTTSKEDGPVQYFIERSVDAATFKDIAAVNGYNNGQNINTYSFTQPDTIFGAVYYRLKIVDQQNKVKFSRVIQLNGKENEINFVNVINPFNQKLQFEIVSSSNGTANMDLVSLQGAVVRRKEFGLGVGINNILVNNTDNLPAGVYVLRIEFNGNIVQKKLVKINSN